MKNFDFISRLAETIPDFAQLHAYCDKAEIFQKAFPEESASNARKAQRLEKYRDKRVGLAPGQQI